MQAFQLALECHQYQELWVIMRLFFDLMLKYVSKCLDCRRLCCLSGVVDVVVVELPLTLEDDIRSAKAARGRCKS